MWVLDCVNRVLGAGCFKKLFRTGVSGRGIEPVSLRTGVCERESQRNGSGAAAGSGSTGVEVGGTTLRGGSDPIPCVSCAPWGEHKMLWFCCLPHLTGHKMSGNYIRVIRPVSTFPTKISRNPWSGGFPAPGTHPVGDCGRPRRDRDDRLPVG